MVTYSANAAIDSIEYVMSLLTEQQIFETVSIDTYRHNVVSLTLRETDVASWIHYLYEYPMLTIMKTKPMVSSDAVNGLAWTMDSESVRI
jgi:hypothetical protein